MRIPHINKLRLENVDKSPSAEVTVNIAPEAYLDDLGLFEDKKEYIRFVIRLKSMIRNSFEYTELISHLKRRVGMDHCGIHPNLNIYNGFRIELHHTPFCLEDIVHIIIKKRLDRGESLKMTDIAREIMELHYLGLVGLYPLCPLCHHFAHSDSGDTLFIPMKDVYGSPEKFWELYKSYATESVQTKYNNIEILNTGYNLIENNIPKELIKKYIYVKTSEDSSDVDVVSTQKLVSFIKELNGDG